MTDWRIECTDVLEWAAGYDGPPFHCILTDPPYHLIQSSRGGSMRKPGTGRTVGRSTFLICPVRGHAPKEILAIVQKLESKGWKVHWPPRDTDQNDEIGYAICSQNRYAIAEADAVHVIWDGESHGCLFDLGMAFALGKPIIVLSLPPETDHKSFQNMVRYWAGRVMENADWHHEVAERLANSDRFFIRRRRVGRNGILDWKGWKPLTPL